MYDIIQTYSDVVYYEADQKYSKDKVLVPDGVKIALGQVVGRVTATGEVVPFDPAAITGEEVVVGVAVTIKEDEAGASNIFIVTRHAIVNDDGLVWPESISEVNKATAIEQLKALGILVQ